MDTLIITRDLGNTMQQGMIIPTATAKVESDYYRHHCDRCGYTWYSRAKQPSKCIKSSCRSPYWNRKRVIKKAWNPPRPDGNKPPTIPNKAIQYIQWTQKRRDKPPKTDTERIPEEYQDGPHCIDTKTINLLDRHS